MSIDAFSQAFGRTDWNQVTATPRTRAAAPSVPAPVSASASVRPAAKERRTSTFAEVLDAARPREQISNAMVPDAAVGGALVPKPAPAVTASAPPVQLHPLARPAASPQTAGSAAAAAPAPARAAIPAQAGGESQGHQATDAANINALQQFARDLASGGQVAGAAARSAAPLPPAAPADSGTDSATSATAGAAGQPQARSGKMPVWGAVGAAPPMPSGYYSPRFRGAYNHAGSAAVPPPQTEAQPTTADVPGAAPSQGQTLGQTANTANQAPPQIPPPEVISQLMIRNLEKYQAMTRNANRSPGPGNYIN